MSKSTLAVTAAVVFAGLLMLACEPIHCDAPKPPSAQDAGFSLPGDPADYAPHPKFEAMKIPADNPITAAKAELGWRLWFDKRLSGDGTRSCYGCHVNEKGLTDGVPLNKGAFEKPLTRHTPTLWNIGYHAELYWDGRAKSLEAQALAAWKLANMGANDEVRPGIVKKMGELYKDDFQKAFGAEASETNIVQALASFMRTIIGKDSDWDRGTMSDAAKRGWEAFQKAKCTNCHAGTFFTDLQFHNVGIGLKDGQPVDVGRQKVTNKPEDTGAFKTPTLRDVARSAPYFHDGSVATLEEAVKFMLGGGAENPFLDKKNLQKAELSDEEVRDLIEFLKALSDGHRIPEPKLP
jgi:cytochrome c peroxidase